MCANVEECSCAAPSLFSAINKGGQLFQVPGASCRLPFCQEAPPALLPPSPVQPAASLLSIILAMALDSVPTYLNDMGSHQAARAQQQRIRKGEHIWTADTYAPYDDGHQWRKYGEKKLSNSNFPRFYYRCTYKNDMKCPATKQVQQKDASDPPLFSVTYFNHHTCSSISNPIGSTRDTSVQSASCKMVPICFSPHSFRDEPQSPSIHPFRGNQQPERSTYATSQFQWTATSSSPTSNSPVKMEVDSFSGARASSSSMGSLPRTLLPIGQSRCIEYFHFL